MHYALQGLGAPAIHPGVMSRHRRWNAQRDASAIIDSLQRETNGASFYFADGNYPFALIRDATTAANNFAGNANSKLVYTSPSNKYVRNAAGVYEAGITLRCDHSAGVPLGLLVEGARTNSLRNNSMQGASAPSTFPTNWVANNSAGCSWSVVGTGTQNGIEYIDVRLQGTANSGFPNLSFESTTQIVAAASQAWASTFFCYLVSGSLTGITTARNLISERTDAGASVTLSATNFTATDTTTLSAARRTHLVASTNASTLRVLNRLDIVEAASGAVDATFRIGWPQLELGAFASSPIRTTDAAVTRAADDISLAVANFPSMASGGYMVARWVPGNVNAATFSAPLSLTADNNNHTRVSQSTAAKRAINLISAAGAPSLVPTGTLAIGTASTVAYMFAASNYKAASDGGAAQTSTAGAALPTYTKLQLGDVNAGGIQPLFGWLQWAKVVPRTNLTDAQVVTESALAL
jgi:hypothetical protein